MRLAHLVLSDIGPFRGTHIIDLTTDSKSNGYAFFGQNGRGKTSIYNAMKWCLWGEVRTRVRTVSGRRVESTVRPIVGEGKRILMNREAYENDSRQEMSVILLAEGEKGRIQVSRTAVAKTALPRDDRGMEIRLVAEFEGESANGREAQEMIESFFPRELQRFFFIDGEALEEYTEMMEGDSVEGVKEGVEAVLRLPSLVRGKDDIQAIRSNLVSSISVGRKKSNAATKARNKAQRVSSDLRELNRDARRQTELLERFRKRAEEVNDAIAKHSEMKVYVDRLREAESNLSVAEKALERSSLQRSKDGSNAYKILLWNKAAEIHGRYDSEMDKSNQLGYEIKSLEKKIKDRRKDVRRMDDVCKDCGQTIPDMKAHISKVKTEIAENEKELHRLSSGNIMPPDELTIRLGRMSAYKPQSGDRDRVDESESTWREDRKRVLSLREEAKKLNSMVTIEAKSELGSLGEEKGTFEAKVRELEVKVENANQKVFQKSMELRDLQARADVITDRQDTSAKLDFEAEKLFNAIDESIDEYLREARVEVELFASEVFMAVTNAPATFKGISVDNDFRAKIVLRSGKTATAPSSGMNSMMTISIIDALRRVSKVNAPIFFDTPGRSLDEEHKHALLEYFWRDHGQQFLIFAHSGEFEVQSTMGEFGDRIAKAFELKWPGDYRECMKCESEDIDVSSKGVARCLVGSCGHEWDTRAEHTIISELSS